MRRLGSSDSEISVGYRKWSYGKGDHAMKPSWRWPVLAGLMSVSGISVCSAATPFMTGGGSVLQSGTTGRVTHGFEVHCGTDANPSSANNSLEVNWGSAGNKHHFELSDVLISSDCFYDPSVGSPNPPPPGFNTFIGDGTGTLDGQSGATIHFTFTDAGEPGGTNGTPPPDTAAFLITDAFGTVVLSVPDTALTYGNHQALAQ